MTGQDAPVPPRTQSDRDPLRAGGVRANEVRRVLGLVLVLNGLVVAVKLVVGLRTHSLAVLGAAMESALDTLNNVVGMTLVSIAGRGPDEDHPYGHAKFESMGTVGIVVFLSISCFELLRSAITALVRARPLHAATGAELGVMAATLIVNVGIVWYERRRGRALASAFLVADAAHTTSDLVVTLLAISALLLTRAGAPRADAVLGILGVRDIRSRSTASGQLFVELTIVVDGRLTVQEAHALADAVEAAVGRTAGSAEVVVHIEPE